MTTFITRIAELPRTLQNKLNPGKNDIYIECMPDGEVPEDDLEILMYFTEEQIKEEKYQIEVIKQIKKS